MTPRERRMIELDPIAERHGLTIDQVLSKKRTPRIVSAKREIAKLLHGNGMGVTEIGRIFGCDHASIHYLIRTQDRAAKGSPSPPPHHYRTGVRMMGWFKDAIDRGVKQGVQNAVDSGAFKEMATGIIQEMLAKPENAFFVFIKHIQAELMRVDPNLPAKVALALAKGVYNQMLHDEKCAFGDARYVWDKGAAIDLAHAYEIDHWESAA